jgi:hypothetical protein
MVKPCPFVVSLSNHERTYDTVSGQGKIKRGSNSLDMLEQATVT